jgi:hypothetical protein
MTIINLAIECQDLFLDASAETSALCVFSFSSYSFFPIFPLDLKNSLWLKGITRREQLSIVSPKLTEEMFEKRNQIGIWFIGEKGHCVCEADQAASMCEGIQNKDLDLYSAAAPDWMGQADLAPLVKKGGRPQETQQFFSGECSTFIY